MLSVKSGEIEARNHDLEPAGTFPVDREVSGVSVDDFDALVLPGGTVNPDKLRLNASAVAFVRDFVTFGKPVAAICHGPWTLVEADLVRDRRLTSWPSLATDVRNAGGTWVDEEVVRCSAGPNVLVTSRKPDDLPAFCRAMLESFAEARHRSSVG